MKPGFYGDKLTVAIVISKAEILFSQKFEPPIATPRK
jgi:hypothetical protein